MSQAQHLKNQNLLSLAPSVDHDKHEAFIRLATGQDPGQLDLTDLIYYHRRRLASLGDQDLRAVVGRILTKYFSPHTNNPRLLTEELVNNKFLAGRAIALGLDYLPPQLRKPDTLEVHKTHYLADSFEAYIELQLLNLGAEAMYELNRHWVEQAGYDYLLKYPRIDPYGLLHRYCMDSPLLGHPPHVEITRLNHHDDANWPQIGCRIYFYSQDGLAKWILGQATSSLEGDAINLAAAQAIKTLNDNPLRRVPCHSNTPSSPPLLVISRTLTD